MKTDTIFSEIRQYACECLEDKENWHGEELERRLRAFCERKWNCSFSEEMSRSVKAMLDALGRRGWTAIWFY